jgi:hypothetical protein
MKSNNYYISEVHRQANMPVAQRKDEIFTDKNHCSAGICAKMSKEWNGGTSSPTQSGTLHELI